MPKVRSRRTVEPQDVDGRRKNQRNQETADCRDDAPPIGGTVPDGQQQPGSEQDDFVSLGGSGGKERAGNPRHPLRTGSCSQSDGERGRRERDCRRVLHAADSVEPQRSRQPDRTHNRQPISRRRHDTGRDKDDCAADEGERDHTAKPCQQDRDGMKHRRYRGKDRLRLTARIHHKRRAKRKVRARRIEELTAIRDVEAAEVVIG